MGDYNIGDWIIVTKGGYGTYSNNIGCPAKIMEIKGNVLGVDKFYFIKNDSSKLDWLSEGYRKAKREEIPDNTTDEPQYEIY